MKTCARCKEPKPAAEFYASKVDGSGLQSYCKVCKKKPPLNQLKIWEEPEPAKPEPVEFATDLKQFLFLLTLPDNKQKVYKETSRLSVYEQIILIQMTRQKDNEWKQVA